MRALVYEVVIGVVLVVGLLALALEAAPGTPLLAEGLQPVGLALALGGGALWLWATVVLVARGEGTPLPLDPPRRLVVSGPYRWLRNPMHLGLVAFFLGEALLFRSPVFVGIVVAGAAGLAAYARWREDSVLSERFGSRYAAYRDEVPAWAPRLEEARRAIGELGPRGRRVVHRGGEILRAGRGRIVRAGRRLTDRR